MKHLRSLGLAGSCLLALGNAEAALNAQGQQEVAELLAFVESSGCTFIRNGDAHAPADARAHLQKKLDYLNDKGLVDSAEDFIARAARVSEILCERHTMMLPRSMYATQEEDAGGHAGH